MDLDYRLPGLIFLDKSEELYILETRDLMLNKISQKYIIGFQLKKKKKLASEQIYLNLIFIN